MVATRSSRGRQVRSGGSSLYKRESLGGAGWLVPRRWRLFWGGEDNPSVICEMTPPFTQGRLGRGDRKRGAERGHMKSGIVYTKSGREYEKWAYEKRGVYQEGKI